MTNSLPFKRGTFGGAVKERLADLSYNSWDSLYLLHKNPEARPRHQIYPTVWIGTDLMNPSFSNLELMERFLNQTMAIALKNRGEDDGDDASRQPTPDLREVVAGLACSFTVKLNRDFQVYFVIEGGHARVDRLYLADDQCQYEDLGPRLNELDRKRILGVTWATHLRSATAAELSGDFQSAVESYKACLQLNEKVPEAFFGLANSFAGRGSDEEAVEFYARALSLRPDFPEAADAHYNRGCSLVRLGRFEDAIQNFRSALQVDTHYANAWFNLGAIHRALGDEKASVDAYQRYMDMTPDEAERRRVEDILEEMGVARPNSRRRGA